MVAKIKICGITNQADGFAAVELGADLLGFNFYQPSPRYIDPAVAADIIAALPVDTVTVGVFVNAEIRAIGEVLTKCPLDMIQLHGDESNADCQAAAALGVRVIKALRIRQPEDIKQATTYNVDAVLLDAFREELYGGTGHKFDWSWVRQAQGQKVFLAGGIGPENITEALELGTYGIDLCSGIEKKPGVKDPNKMKTLFEKVAQYYANQHA